MWWDVQIFECLNERMQDAEITAACTPDGHQHLANRDVRLVAVSKAPHPTLAAWATRAGWTFPWVSSGRSRFNEDMGVTLDGNGVYNYKPSTATGEMPGMSVFIRQDNDVFHTYSTFSRGLEPMNPTYAILDLAPKGRDEEGLPWPMAWVRRLVDGS